MHQLWNSCIPLEWAFARFLRRMDESLRVLSGQFHNAEKISERPERFSDYQGTIRFSPDKPLPIALVKKLVKARIAENRT